MSEGSTGDDPSDVFTAAPTPSARDHLAPASGTEDALRGGATEFGGRTLQAWFTAEEYVRAALDSSAGGFYGVDHEGVTTVCNSAFLKMLGFERSGDVIGRRLHEVIHHTRADGSHYPQEQCPIYQTARTGKPAHVVDDIFFRLDGTSFPVEYWTVPIVRDGEVLGAVTTFIDVTERKAAERALREARSRLEAALTAGEIGTFVWDVVADRMYGDRNFTKLFGIPLDKDGVAPLAAFVAAIHPDDREPTLALVQRTLDMGIDYEAEYRIVTGGRERWVIARGKAERDATGAVVRFPGVLLDITDRVRAEQARREMAERLEHQSRLFESVASTTPDFIYIFDREGRFLYANRRLLEVWGRKFEDAVGKNLYELGYPEWHADMHVRELAEVIRTKQAITGEVPFTGGSGIFGVYEYIFTPVLGPDGEVDVIAGTTRDVTVRKQAELDLRQGKELLDIALAASETGTFRFDLTKREFVVFDQNLKRLCGLPEQAVVRAPEDLFAIIHQEDLDVVSSETGRTILDAVDFETEYRVVQPDGQVRWLFHRAKVIRNREGQPVYLVGACTDITRRKQSEQAAQALLEAERKARAEAEAASRLKDEFLATLSHELRTPLNAILGWSQILRRHSGDDAETRDGFAVIERNARVQVQLIEDLLDMSRIVSGKLRLDVQRLDLAMVIKAAVEAVTPAAEAKNIRIQLVLDTHVAPVRGDMARLQQVVWNLLSNAIKFTPKGGKVVVALERVNSHIEISVTDNGVGIDPEFLPYVFERFRQADGAATRKHGGLGLGLAIVKSLVEMHGGVVRAKSPGVGKGAVFSVELPLMVVNEHDSAERRHPVAPAWDRESEPSDECILQNVCVLVVDDEKDARDLIRRVLEDCQGRAILASSAQEAFELLRRERPDVLVSDIGMPDEDGYSLIRRVRELSAREGGDTPAVALTAFARSEDRRRALIAGFQAHVAKPVEPSELVTVVASVAGKMRRPRGQDAQD